jgi:hypothetical protein
MAVDHRPFPRVQNSERAQVAQYRERHKLGTIASARKPIVSALQPFGTMRGEGA